MSECALCRSSGLLWAGRLPDACPLCDGLASLADEPPSVPMRAAFGAADVPDDPKSLRCPLMSIAEVAEITVPFAEVEGRLAAVLERYGAAVVTGVASAEECRELEALFTQDLAEIIDDAALEGASGHVKKAVAAALEDPRLWPKASMVGLGDLDRCQLRGLPHGRFAWRARLHPNARRVYEVLHGTDELVSSCDNSFFSSGASNGTGVNRSWPHVDHNRHDCSLTDASGKSSGDWDVFQGILYVWPSTEPNHSTTVVWTGSHTDVYEELMVPKSVQQRGRKSKHFTSFDVARAESLIPQWQSCARRVPVPAGGLFVWSSRTVHQGWSGGPRLAQPVCWEPADRRTEKARERKLRLAALGLPSTHWGSLGLPHDLVVKDKARLAQPLGASGQGSNVTIPLVSTMQPVTLVSGVKIDAMWQQLSEIDWWQPLPGPLKELLEKSIAQTYIHAL